MRRLTSRSPTLAIVAWLVAVMIFWAPLVEAASIPLGASASFSPPAAVRLVAYNDGYTLDQARTDSLTRYLHTHRLPLVGGQVLTGASGNRQVVLWGFVATPFGKKDAVTKSRRFLRDPSIPVDNRIVIRPELLASNRPSAKSSPSSSSYRPPSVGGLKGYEGQYSSSQSQQYQQYQQQGAPDALTALLPLLAITGLALMGGMASYGSYGGPGVYGSYGPYGRYQRYPAYPPTYPYGPSP